MFQLGAICEVGTHAGGKSIDTSFALFPERCYMAKVSVRLYATLRSLSGSSELHMEADDLSGLERALRARCGRQVGALLGSGSRPFEAVVVLVNGVTLRPDAMCTVTLRDGDEVSLFPPVDGG